MTSQLGRFSGYCFGALSGANGHALFVRDWPEELMDPGSKDEPCAYCAARGLKHGWK